MEFFLKLESLNKTKRSQRKATQCTFHPLVEKHMYCGVRSCQYVLQQENKFYSACLETKVMGWDILWDGMDWDGYPKGTGVAIVLRIVQWPTPPF